MKMKKIALFATAFALSSCSLGANVVSKGQFKNILTSEIKPTVITTSKNQQTSFGVTKNLRNISEKTLNQEEYNIETSALQYFTTTTGLEKNLAVTATKSVITNVTKEIINSAGVKTFADVEKAVVTEDYSLENEVDSTTNVHTVKIAKETTNITISTDYLYVELDPISGRIAKAEITVDDDILDFKTKKVVYDTFERLEPEEPEEGEQETPVISLEETKWKISDSNNIYSPITISVISGADKIVSKNVAVGDLTFGTNNFKFYSIEKGDGVYNFEIRSEQKSTEETLISSQVYTNDQTGVSTVVLPKIDEYFATALVAEIESNIFNSYKEAYDFMESTIDTNKPIEILSQQSGIVYRVIDGTMYNEILVSKKDDDNGHRKITNVVKREGFDGNVINYLEFNGFKI